MEISFKVERRPNSKLLLTPEAFRQIQYDWFDMPGGHTMDIYDSELSMAFDEILGIEPSITFTLPEGAL